MANLSPARPEQLESKQLEQQINALGATGRPAGHPGYVETLFPDLFDLATLSL